MGSERQSPCGGAVDWKNLRQNRNRLEPELTYMGRLGLNPGTRELIEKPYIIVYEVHEDRGEIVVLAIVHGAQKRKPKTD